MNRINKLQFEDDSQVLAYLVEKFDDIYNWAGVCKLAGVNYQVFRNSKRVGFIDMKPQKCRQIIYIIEQMAISIVNFSNVR